MRDWWSTPPDSIQHAITEAGVSERKCRLFAIARCRQWGDRIQDEQSKNLIELADLFVDGLVTKTRLRGARRVVYRWAHEYWRTPGWPKDWIRYWAAWNAAVPKIVPPCIGFFNYDDEFRGIAADICAASSESVAFDPAWRTTTTVGLARQMYESRDFSPMPILADALQDAGCEQPDVLAHCRGNGPHARGCWVVDVVLGKV